MNRIIKMVFFSILFFITQFHVYANGFEGSISFVKESCFDTTYFTYFVSEGKIRIDEYNGEKVLVNAYIININNEEVLVVNYEQKMYKRLKTKTTIDTDNKGFSIIKTMISKEINCEKCYQWRVRNKEKNTEVAYWVTQNDFTFFDKMIKILNHTDRSWEFFNHIPQSAGYLPMLSVERNLVRDEKNRTQVLQITRKPIDSAMFRIPSDYKLLVM
jgi:hypothetical protein